MMMSVAEENVGPEFEIKGQCEYEEHQLLHDMQTAYPNNLMLKNFDIKWFNQLSQRDRYRVLRCTRSGFEQLDSSVGIYALDASDYDDFSYLFDRILRDYHRIPENEPIRHVESQHTSRSFAPDSKAYTSISTLSLTPDATCYSTASSQVQLPRPDDTMGGIESVRLRVARNLEGYPYPSSMTCCDRLHLENKMKDVFDRLIADPRFGGHYVSLTPGTKSSISAEVHRDLARQHLMFSDMSVDRYLCSAGISNDWPHGRGCYITDSKELMVWVGEEDHLRIICTKNGDPTSGTLSSLCENAHGDLQALIAALVDQGQLTFSVSPKYGYLTSCPSNAGSGMRASVHVKLPHLTWQGTSLDRVRPLANAVGLSLRGEGGEHTGSNSHGLVDLSPSKRLGVDEVGTLDTLHKGLKVLLLCENMAASSRRRVAVMNGSRTSP